MKFPPGTVRVNWGELTVAEEGEIEEMEGMGFEVMVKVTELEVPPPGAGLLTVIAFAPAEARSEAGIIAVNWVLET